MKKMFVALALSGAAAILPAAAHAAAVLPTSSTNPLIVNFDLRGFTPAPNYQSIGFKFEFDPSSSYTSTVYQFYGASNASGFITASQFPPVFYNNGVTAFSTANSMYNPLNDGVFSIGLYSSSGTVKLLSAAAQGYGANWQATPYQTFTFSAAAVPEPATWAMMLIGFGAVGYSMRSRKVGYKAVKTA